MTSTHFERLLESLEKVRKISVQIECQMAPPTAIYSILVNFLMPLVLLGGSYLLLGGQIPNESFIAFLIMSMAISGLLISFEHYYIMLKDLKLAADNLEKACIDTIESGKMTKDLALITELENPVVLNSLDFIKAIRETLEKIYA